jgi:hypothetical protein
MTKKGIANQIVIWCVGALVVGALFGASVVNPDEIVSYVDVPGETVYVDVPGEDVIVEVVDSRFDYWAERVDIATACVGSFALDWQEEIVISETVGNTTSTSDYDDYIEDGSTYDVSDSPDLTDGHRLLNDVTLSETDHEDNDWTCSFQVDYEDDNWNENTYNVSVNYEDGDFDDLEVIAA